MGSGAHGKICAPDNPVSMLSPGPGAHAAGSIAVRRQRPEGRYQLSEFSVLRPEFTGRRQVFSGMKIQVLDLKIQVTMMLSCKASPL